MIQRSAFRYFKTPPKIIRLAVMMYVRFAEQSRSNDIGLPVAVKNAIALDGMKDFAGVFALPWAVVNDLDLLD